MQNSFDPKCFEFLMMNDPDLKISYKFAISGGNMGFQHIVQNQDT